jgi:hypothetical protein
MTPPADPAPGSLLDRRRPGRPLVVVELAPPRDLRYESTVRLAPGWASRARTPSR